MSEKAYKVIDENAEKSGNSTAFLKGMLFGLSAVHEYLERYKTLYAAKAAIEVMIERISEHYFNGKKN